MLNAAYGMLAMLPLAFCVGRVRDGVVIQASSPSPIAESASSTIDPDAQVPRAANGELVTMVKRLRVKRAQKRCEHKEFKAWLQITAKPLCEILLATLMARRALPNAYNDVHWGSSRQSVDGDTQWGLQPALMSAVSGWSLRRFGGGRAS